MINNGRIGSLNIKKQNCAQKNKIYDSKYFANIIVVITGWVLALSFLCAQNALFHLLASLLKIPFFFRLLINLDSFLYIDIRVLLLVGWLMISQWQTLSLFQSFIRQHGFIFILLRPVFEILFKFLIINLLVFLRWISPLVLFDFLTDFIQLIVNVKIICNSLVQFLIRVLFFLHHFNVF